MIVEYTFLPEKHLVRVDIKSKLEFKKNLYHAFFGEIRDTWVDDEGNWLGIECEISEWRKYLVFVWGSLGAAGMLAEQLEVYQDLILFMQWCGYIREDPLFNQVGIVA